MKRSATSASKAPSAPARGKAKAVKQPVHGETEAEAPQCPLCIENLGYDEYNNFRPCPCGYLICVFCYHRVKELCAGLCPGCRRQYGSIEEAQVTNVPSAASAASSEPLAGNSKPAAAPTRTATPTEQRMPPPPPPKPTSNSRSTAESGSTSKKVDEASLPSLATWGTAAPSQRATQDVGRQPVDDSTWPSLANSAGSSSTQKPRNELDAAPRKAPSKVDQTAAAAAADTGIQKQNMGGGVESGPSQVSGGEGYQQQLQHPPQQHPPQQQGYHPPVTHDNGAGVSDPLPSIVPMPWLTKPTNGAVDHQTFRAAKEPPQASQSRVEPTHLESKAPLSHSPQNDVATAHLFSMLHLRDNSKAQAFLAAGKVPPGFAPTTQLTSPIPVAPILHDPVISYPFVHSNSLNNQENPIVAGPPGARYHPISPPLPIGHGASTHSTQAGDGRANGHLHGQGPATSSHQQQGVYSIWSGPNLPVDISRQREISPPVDFWNGYQIPQPQPNSSGQATHPSGISCYDPVVVFPAHNGPKRPPPGFALPVMNVNGQQQQQQQSHYQPLGPQRYNPLEAGPRIAPTQMAPYRPTLGLRV